jgi:hypothetical protein
LYFIAKSEGFRGLHQLVYEIGITHDPILLRDWGLIQANFVNHIAKGLDASNLRSSTAIQFPAASATLLSTWRSLRGSLM